ncbi:flavin-containing monooxygenase FMO GS-OX-like 3 [Hibiscus syriacus]|uniref:flavin-containing monooxygenase FMO GS-OX-like 3 n=1 Tax=Hibiscus syriacus TaxID=106335 RepID=UPI0019230291|nr:flavin-containing monooxygenase FMO GS-OX-like 3 [Hibiscus syriacus]
MSFLDYPFVKKEEGDPRTFLGHEEMHRFIEDFAQDFGLMELTLFGHEVIWVELVDEASHEWVVESRTEKLSRNGNQRRRSRDTWPGLQMHSHNYRTPEEFENKIVIPIGNGPSAVDILKEISPLAKQVHLAVRTPTFQITRVENYDNAWQHSMIECAQKDGKVVFQDGPIVDADVIIHCTGYKYHYPFLKSSGIVTVDDNRVGPMYKHVFPPSLAPWLSFVGLNNRASV